MSTTPFTVISGGICAPKGFSAAGVHCGIRHNHEKRDLALIVADVRCAGAGCYTTNKVYGAPIKVDRAHLQDGYARAILVNSGNANTCAPGGLELAQDTCKLVADALGIDENDVLPSSTGVIGQHLDLLPFQSGAPAAVASLSRDGGDAAARAIMTTDTHSKQYAVSFSGDGIGYPGAVFTVGGMAKGAGMIMPSMATMISVVTTDAPVKADFLHDVLVRCVNKSFNRVTVDSDTSTNDSCFLMASGAAAPEQGYFEPNTPAGQMFERAVMFVCASLAREMAADGEGATRLVLVRVAGAATDADADAAARTVANSPLVKTAIFGHDANWGRIAGALGRSGARFNQEDVSIDILGLPVCRQGLTVPFDEEEALRRFERPEIDIDVDLGAGECQSIMWTCDFSYEYVKINGEYRS